MTTLTCRYFLLALFIYVTKSDVVDKYYPRYHLAPPHGWMNDPNGFSYFREEYHLFYQYNPKTSQGPGITHWGHAKSKDLFHWEHLPIAMYPDKPYDKSGVFSGSALIEDDTMYLFYTGNVNQPENVQYQALASSTDGVTVTKYDENPVISAPEYQPHIRDPKVWKHMDTYYMVLGNSFNNGTLGRVLLYSSKDKKTWEQVSVLDESDGQLGYMWECPDFFELDGKFVLLFSPQGIKSQGDKYKNLFQTGYIVGNFDYETHKFSPLTKFVELDFGHDFYATQTIVGRNNERLLVAWFNMWEQNYPERNDGWAGQMTIIRELSLTNDNHLIQKPVTETTNVLGDLLYWGGKSVELSDNTADINIRAQTLNDLNLFIESNDESSTVKITYKHDDGTITLDRGGEDGVRRTEWTPKGKLQWRIFIDASSIELFCGEGEVTFSSRFFPTGKVSVRLDENSTVEEIFVRSMQHTVPDPSDQIP